MIINFNLYMKSNATSKDGNLLENITMLDILLIFIDYERDGIKVDEKVLTIKTERFRISAHIW